MHRSIVSSRCRHLPVMAFAGVMLFCCHPTPAAAASGSSDAALAAERQTVLATLRTSAAELERVRSASTGTVAALEASAAAIRGDLAGLQKQLLSVLAKDDPAAIKTTRALLAARQAALDADEGESTLEQKKVEEAERERDMWKKRAATLELALRMDIKTMLAGSTEIEDRDKRVDAAEKEIAAQKAQIRKYSSRRDAAAVRRAMLLRRLAALPSAVIEEIPAECRQAHAAEARQVQRLISQQEEWFRLNRLLEERAGRNLAFARTDYLVSQRYAAALARKATARRAVELQSFADRSDAQMTLLRAGIAPVQQAIVTNLAAATLQTDVAQRAIGDSSTASDEEQSRAAYAVSQERKARWEAENDCFKEFLALQKAGAAFLREQAERTRSLAEERSLEDINQEEEQLRASLVTSELYVRSMELQLQLLDTQIESVGRQLGLQPAAGSNLNAAVAGVFESFDASRPPAVALVVDLLRSQAERLAAADPAAGSAAAGRHETGAKLLARMVQREMLQERKGISVRWLANSRQAIQTLERLAGYQLWQQHDARVNAVTSMEMLTLAGTVCSGAVFCWDSWMQGIHGVPGVPSPGRMTAGLVLTLLLGLAGWLAARALPAATRLGRLGRSLAPTLLPLAGAAWMALSADRENLVLLWIGWTLLLLAGWVLLRNLLLTSTRAHLAPAGNSLGGAGLTLIDTLLVWTAVLLPLYRLAGAGVNAWDTQTVLARLWLFGVCLALFRLAMHPVLAGRFLNRHSESRLVRILGGFAAGFCVLVAALAAITSLAGLDNLGRSVLHTTVGTFVVLAVALVVTAILNGLAHRHVSRAALTVALFRVAQFATLLVAAAAAGWLWWLLLNRAVLASNAPPPIPEIVTAVGHGLHALVRFWHAQLTAGMTVASLTRGLLVFIASFWVSRQAKSLMQQRMLAHTPMDEATRQTFANVFGYVVIVLGFLVGLNVAGSSLQNLALLAGAITVGVGFGLQNVINNFVSSLLIHFGRTIRVGDYIDVGGTRGTVREIGMRNTVLQTDDEITVLVPNGSFITANIVNWTNPSRRTRMHVAVTVLRQADLTAVAELAVAAAGRNPLILRTPAPVLEVRSVTAAQISLDLQFWSEHPEKAAAITGALSLELDRVLREKGFAA
ncbi:MAG: mechanosensitive ion channel domain-containing protein [bacterium]